MPLDAPSQPVVLWLPFISYGNAWASSGILSSPSRRDGLLYVICKASANQSSRASPSLFGWDTIILHQIITYTKQPSPCTNPHYLLYLSLGKPSQGHHPCLQLGIVPVPILDGRQCGQSRHCAKWLVSMSTRLCLSRRFSTSSITTRLLEYLALTLPIKTSTPSWTRNRDG